MNEGYKRREYEGPHSLPLPLLWRTVLGFLAVSGCISVGFQVAGTYADRASARTEAASQDRSEAQAHYSTCLSTLNANWRRAYSVVGVALTTPPGSDIDAHTASRLHLPASRALVVALGQRRLIAALADDARIGAKADPICPFVAGRPGDTPAEPVKSATAALDN